jgi:hypothetical protein
MEKFKGYVGFEKYTHDNFILSKEVRELMGYCLANFANKGETC